MDANYKWYHKVADWFKYDFRKGMQSIFKIVLSIGIGIGVIALFPIALGFGAAGIIAGSCAACCQSQLALEGGGSCFSLV